MGRRAFATMALQGVALALLALMIAVAPAVAAGGVLLSGSPPLQRWATDHLRRFELPFAMPMRIDRGGTDS